MKLINPLKKKEKYKLGDIYTDHTDIKWGILQIIFW